MHPDRSYPVKRYMLLALLTLLPARAAAQTPLPPVTGRAIFAQSGRQTMPMGMIDEANLSPELYARHQFPPEFWAQEKACLVALGKRVDKVGTPPDILVIPAVRTIRVHDITVDSLLYAEDSTYAGENWEAPTVAVSLVHTNFIVITAQYQANPYVLRHEALHFMLWRQRLAPMGHPRAYFGPCDIDYEPGVVPLALGAK